MGFSEQKRGAQRGVSAEVEAALRDRCDAWDAMHRRYFSDYDERWRHVAEIVNDHGAGREIRVLDLGCGPGTLTRRLATAVPHAEVTGIDADPLLVAIARALAPGTRTRVELGWVNTAEATTRLNAHGPFDVIVSSAFVHYFDASALTALHHMCRTLLAPGGMLITAERFADGTESAEQAPSDDPWSTWWAQTRSNTAISSLDIPSAPPAPAPSALEVAPLTRDDYLHTLRAAGFRPVGADTSPHDPSIVVALSDTFR